MKTLNFVLFLVAVSVAILLSNICFINKGGCLVWEVIGQTILGFSVLVLNSKLVEFFNRGTHEEFIEPQSYLFVLIFVTNILKHAVCLFIIYQLDANICPYTLGLPIKNNSFLFNGDMNDGEDFRNDNVAFVSFIVVKVLNGVANWSFAVICTFRFYLSFQEVKEIRFVLKLIVLASVISFPAGLVIFFSVEYRDPDIVFNVLTMVPPLVVGFLILVAYSARNRFDEHNNLQYFTLWILYILFQTCNIGLYILVYLKCNGYSSKNLTKIGLQIILASHVIIPISILLTDKTLRNIILTQQQMSITNAPLLQDRENTSYGAVGTVVEDPRFSAQADIPTASDDPRFGAQNILEQMEFPIDDPMFSPQLFESVSTNVKENNELNI